ncbi:hypothetical protein [Actinophytocola sp.]|uniref:hypothetical protein n=1 Tax=Actinophytocola sp. TaxID=1872138 RepID=UPI002ED67722
MVDRERPLRTAGGGLTGSGAIADTNRGATGYALRNDGTVWAWGGNAHSELGAPDAPSGRPVRVTGLTGVTAIAATAGTGYASRNDGTV